mmetsp:Transcript_87292/g.245014  ORF Transcript_87292/g.245014 Transcript_87292/m.245014 type:complete len:226 (-) Transcript_87292:66-743(-)|eukprot:CAMPEP_0117526038 /NCGR_PEP_ID=MMETSP0784-20121206/36081_1 /TAXON_ID=39447 /ORGANISM="" /LENGTH=225 /DNA_ID=CAMNT_0005322257 /DNA_START=85 /DNA_END=762 /DNA_ORIENTATION=-
MGPLHAAETVVWSPLGCRDRAEPGFGVGIGQRCWQEALVPPVGHLGDPPQWRWGGHAGRALQGAFLTNDMANAVPMSIGDVRGSNRSEAWRDFLVPTSFGYSGLMVGETPEAPERDIHAASELDVNSSADPHSEADLQDEAALTAELEPVTGVWVVDVLQTTAGKVSLCASVAGVMAAIAGVRALARKRQSRLENKEALRLRRSRREEIPARESPFGPLCDNLSV